MTPPRDPVELQCCDVHAVRYPGRIASRDDLNRYMALDQAANGVSRWPLIGGAYRYPCVKYLRILRRLERLLNSRGPRLLVLPRTQWLRHRLRVQGLRTGLSIPPLTCGPGLMLPHHGTIIVNSRARVGAFVCLNAGVTIGAAYGEVPVVGNHVYISPNSVVSGKLTLGTGVVVGANSVVTKSVDSGMLAIGAPATGRRPIEVDSMFSRRISAAWASSRPTSKVDPIG